MPGRSTTVGRRRAAAPTADPDRGPRPATPTAVPGFADPPFAYSTKRRKIATAFWPPKPKPLMIAVSTFLALLTFGM